MQQIINFLIGYKNLLLFLFLLSVSLVLTVRSHEYHANHLFSSTNAVTGGILDSRASITDYFDLKTHNKALQDENARLRMLLEKERGLSIDSTLTLQLNDSLPYIVKAARAINFSYNKKDNFITIDKGTKDSVYTDMGVINARGVVGIVDGAGTRYSRVMSLLNTNIPINAKIKGRDAYGSLRWDGVSPYEMQLLDIARKTNVRQGDTIITGAQSSIFPEGILIGTVKEAALNIDGTYYDITVTLSNDLTALGPVYTIKKRDKAIIQSIEIPSDEQ